MGFWRERCWWRVTGAHRSRSDGLVAARSGSWCVESQGVDGLCDPHLMGVAVSRWRF